MVETVKVADQRDFLNALYYGDGGTGKTTALATMANLGRTLYVDAESGIKRRPLERLGIKVDNLEILQFDNNVLSFAALEEAFWSIKRDLEDDPESWAGMVWDSGTEIYHALLDNLVNQRVEKAERLQRGGKNVSEFMSDRFFVERDQYGVMSEQIRFLLRRFRDLPCHFGIAFLERRDQDDRTGQVRIGPSITPGLQSDVIGWHDVVCRTVYDAPSDTYTGTFRPEGVRQGKDRYGVLPKVMVDPSIDRIVRYINGELQESTDPRQGAVANDAEGVKSNNNDGNDGTTKSADPLSRAKAAAASRAGAKG